jgi:hypothetical protein
LRRTEGRKWFLRDSRTLETSLYRLYQRGILRDPEGR